MDYYIVPFKGNFQKHFINVLDIDSGVEFVADDILNLVGSNNVIKFEYCNLPKSLYRIRTVLIDGLLCDKETLNWLGLQKVFRKIGYRSQKEFVRWTRKSLLPALTLEKLDDFEGKTLDGINTLSWFFNSDKKFIESLKFFHQSNLNFIRGESSSPFGFNNGILASKYHAIYSKLLRKEVNIPSYQTLRTSDLRAKLLRQRYLESALSTLAVSNIEYSTLYKAFICSQDNLLSAQELDIAVLYELKRSIPLLTLQVIEGGFFLQSLLACTLDKSIERLLSLQIKEAYICWLNQILENIKV